MSVQTDKKITINQVAEYCGVSKTTISRFLNGKYENMSVVTKEKIKSAIEELNYRPDRSAQRLKTSRTMLIGCVMGDVGSPFSALLFKGISSVCEEAGYQVLFANSLEDAKRERRAIQGFLDNRVDGLIVNTCGSNDGFLIDLHSGGTPIVLADRPIKSRGIIDTVRSDDRKNAMDCTQFLFDRGYKQVAFFAETIADIAPRIMRRDAYLQGVELFGGREAEGRVYEISRDEDVAGYIEDFRGRYPGQRVAVISTNGTTSQRILTAMKQLDIKAGYDFGLCTFDDWSWLRMVEPGITAIAMGTEEIGAKSARLLLERIGGDRGERREAAELIVPGRLVIRGSTPKE